MQFPFRKLVIASLFLICFALPSIAQEKPSPRKDAIEWIWNLLDRLPERADLIAMSVRPSEGAKEPKAAAAIREYFDFFVMFMAANEGFPEDSVRAWNEYESMIHFGRRARLEECFGDTADALIGGTILIAWPPGAASDRAKKNLESMPAKDFEVGAEFGLLRRFEPAKATKKKRIYASGNLRGRYVMIITDSTEDLARLTSTEPKKDGGLRTTVREHLERMKGNFSESGVLQMVREVIYDHERVSAYFPSGDDALTEVRWFKDPITPSYFPSFKDRIGKLEVPPPKWVITVMFSRHKVEAKIVDKHTYEIRRITLEEGPPSDLGVFLNFSRLGEVPEGNPDFKMPADFGRL